MDAQHLPMRREKAVEANTRVVVCRRHDGYYFHLVYANDFQADHGPYTGDATARLAAEYLILILEHSDFFG